MHDNMDWLRLVNSERVRKDVSHKLAAVKHKRTTEFDIRVNDMVSYMYRAGGLQSRTS